MKTQCIIHIFRCMSTSRMVNRMCLTVGFMYLEAMIWKMGMNSASWIMWRGQRRKTICQTGGARG